jgi:malonyl-CoA decarboxylase
LERINWLGDVSAKGVGESASLLVNYKYDLAKIETHHEAYANEGIVAHSKRIAKLLDDALVFAENQGQNTRS